MQWLNYPTAKLIPAYSVIVGSLVASHGIALITTILRLIYRRSVHRLWWDDFWAFIALLADILLWSLYVAFPLSPINKPLSFQQFWKMTSLQAGVLALWASRMSIAVTIVRLVADGRFRLVCKGSAWVFVAFWFTTTMHKVFICGPNDWQDLPLCPLSREATYTIFAVDLASDLWLLGAPVYMLAKMKISKNHRCFIMAIFSCAIFVAFASIAHAYFNIRQEIYWVGLSAHIQLGVSITVCNLLVLATYVYRVCSACKAANAISSSPSDETSRRTHGMTTRDPTKPITLTDIESDFGYSQFADNSVHSMSIGQARNEDLPQQFTEISGHYSLDSQMGSPTQSQQSSISGTPSLHSSPKYLSTDHTDSRFSRAKLSDSAYPAELPARS